MTITVELTPQEEPTQKRLASRVGLTPEEYLRRSLLPKRRKPEAKRSLGESLAEVLGTPHLGLGGTSKWSEIEEAAEPYSGIPADQRPSTGASLLKYAGTWVGDDIQARLDEAYASMSKA